MLSKIFCPKTYEVTGKWRRLHNEELNDLHCSTYILLNKSRMGLTGHVARMRERGGVNIIVVGKRDHLQDISLDEVIILKWIFKK
jgi:hypothetical protein